MLLAAGRGERMRPLTDTRPKPLLEVGGKSLVTWHIERLAHAGFTELVINHAHLGSMIEAALGTGSRYGVRIRYSPEAQALESAGGIANARTLLGPEPFAVINADIFCSYDFARLRDLAGELSARNRLAHLVLVPNPAQHRDGDFVLSGDEVRVEGGIRHTFSGIGVYAQRLFTEIAPGEKAKLAPLLRKAMDQGRVGGELFLGRWVDVGTPQRLSELNRELAQGGMGDDGGRHGSVSR